MEDSEIVKYCIVPVPILVRTINIYPKDDIPIGVLNVNHTVIDIGDDGIEETIHSNGNVCRRIYNKIDGSINPDPDDNCTQFYVDNPFDYSINLQTLIDKFYQPPTDEPPKDEPLIDKLVINLTKNKTVDNFNTNLNATATFGDTECIMTITNRDEKTDYGLDFNCDCKKILSSRNPNKLNETIQQETIQGGGVASG